MARNFRMAKPSLAATRQRMEQAQVENVNTMQYRSGQPAGHRSWRHVFFSPSKTISLSGELHGPFGFGVIQPDLEDRKASLQIPGASFSAFPRLELRLHLAIDNQRVAVVR
ncbi:hypothetical protein [Bradyrhizobium acaciae]|uniref:hypothetical protein n=1 Tax=Bradyrhizobium acaciae TaxID=2683706 RepID=UPI001E4E30D8|nr:hypothetical protein [Bradyrhizobium acaciae]MCC8977286.1 hypothetical protein [Bradyrhizobium acaciae]